MPTGQLDAHVIGERHPENLRWRELRYTVRPGLIRSATLITSDRAAPPARGVVLAHGGTDDGRHFFFGEAAVLAHQGAAVVLPAVRLRLGDSFDDFAADIRDAVLTLRRALDVLTDVSLAPADHLSYLGHSAGAMWGAYLCAIELRLSRVGVFATGSGTFTRSTREVFAPGARSLDPDLAAAADWFETGRFVDVEGSRELLVQHGRRDREVPLAEGRALYEMAADPKRWIAYDWGHDLDVCPAARHDRAEFVMGDC